MAIDSARKRRNAAGVTFPSTVAVTPDASEGVEWRASVAWGYYMQPSAEIDLRPPYTATWTDPARVALWTDPSRTAS